MKFLEFQKLFHEKLGINHLADIARELNVTPQAVSNWKSRDRIPYKYVVQTRKIFLDNDFNLDTEQKNKINESNQLSNEYNNIDIINDDTISIIDIFITMARHIRIIIIIPFVFCLLMIINVQFRLPYVYQSSAKIMSPSKSSNSQAGAIASQFGISIPSNSSSEAKFTYPEILKSRTLAREMLKRKFDTERFGQQKSLLQILTYGNQKPEVSIDILTKQGINNIISMMTIDDKGSYYILTTTANEAIFARDFTIALIEELDNYQRVYNKAKTSETRKFIESRILETKKELEIAEEGLKDFRDRNRRIQNSPSLLLEQERLSREVVVLTGVFTTLKQQLETTKIEEVKESNYVIILDRPEAPMNPSGPRKKRMVILSGLFGLGLGLFASFMIEIFQKSDDSDSREKIIELKSIIKNNLFKLKFISMVFKK